VVRVQGIDHREGRVHEGPIFPGERLRGSSAPCGQRTGTAAAFRPRGSRARNEAEGSWSAPPVPVRAAHRAPRVAPPRDRPSLRS
jgi:hypothetical protein